MKSLLEVCANSFRSAQAAQDGGAYRVELCDNLPEGGTTPSYGQILQCKKHLTLKIYPIIRPRGGDFLYTDEEFEIMKHDVQMCKDLGCDGVVFGILNADGTLDIARNQMLIDLAKPMPSAMHRAFDMTPNLAQSLEICIELGFERILTSGAESSALKGAETLATLVQKAQNRISIMPGAGIKPSNIAEIKQITKANEFHASAKDSVKSKMEYRNPNLSMGTTDDEFVYELTQEEMVKQIINQL